MKVTILGAGYVGLTTGVALAYIGHDVICVDTDENRIADLRAGRLPIFEPHLAELCGLVDGRIEYSSRPAESIAGADAIFIAVGTPSLPSGGPNLSYLQAAAASIGQNLGTDFVVIVNKSTAPIGSGNWVESLVAEGSRRQRRPRQHFSVVSNPEFLREGSAVFDSLYPDRIVLGSDDSRAAERMRELYKPILQQTFSAPAFLPRPESVGVVPLITTDLASAELIKYAANSFLAMKISFINEIGQLADKVGGDIRMIAKGIGLDPRIGSRFLQAGIGWGGSCFGKDTAALISSAAEYGLTMPLVAAAREINSRQREHVVKKLLDELRILKGKTIGLLGLAFKPSTDDLRDAPAIEIARQLIDRGAWVRAHDPVALSRARREFANMGISFEEDVEAVATDADALVLVTEWNEYRDLPWEKIASLMRGKLVLDGRSVLDAERLGSAGIHLVGIGTRTSANLNGAPAMVAAQEGADAK